MELLISLLSLAIFFVLWRTLAQIRDDIRKIRLAAEVFANEKVKELRTARVEEAERNA